MQSPSFIVFKLCLDAAIASDTYFCVLITYVLIYNLNHKRTRGILKCKMSFTYHLFIKDIIMVKNTAWLKV